MYPVLSCPGLTLGQGDLRTYYDLAVGYRFDRLLRLAKLLSSDPWQGPVFLQVRLSAKDRALELGCGHPAELLLERTLRSKLEL